MPCFVVGLLVRHVNRAGYLLDAGSPNQNCGSWSGSASPRRGQLHVQDAGRPERCV